MRNTPEEAPDDWGSDEDEDGHDEAVQPISDWYLRLGFQIGIVSEKST